MEKSGGDSGSGVELDVIGDESSVPLLDMESVLTPTKQSHRSCVAIWCLSVALTVACLYIAGSVVVFFFDGPVSVVVPVACLRANNLTRLVTLSEFPTIPLPALQKWAEARYAFAKWTKTELTVTNSSADCSNRLKVYFKFTRPKHPIDYLFSFWAWPPRDPTTATDGGYHNTPFS